MSIGVWELVLILLIVLLVFGAGKLPNIMSDVGKGIKSLKDSLKDEDNKKEKETNKDKEDKK